MSRTWIRRPPEPRERVALATLAVGAGALVAGTVWYLGRILVARDEMELRPPARPERTLERSREPGAKR